MDRASTKDTSRNTKPSAGNPVPSSLSSVIVFVVLRRSSVEIVLHQHRHHAVVLELIPDTLLDRSPGIVSELNVC